MIVDTSAFLAGLAADQPHHEACAEILNSEDRLATSPLVLAELDRILTTRFGSAVSAQAFRHIAETGIEVAGPSWHDVAQAVDVMEQYTDLGLGLTDSSLVVLAKQHGTNEILTLDQRYFRAIRGLDGRNFKLLPFDSR